MQGLNDRLKYANLFSLSIFSFCLCLRALMAACHFLNCAVVIFDVSIFSLYSTFWRLMLVTYLQRSLPKIRKFKNNSVKTTRNDFVLSMILFSLQGDYQLIFTYQWCTQNLFDSLRKCFPHTIHSRYFGCLTLSQHLMCWVRVPCKALLAFCCCPSRFQRVHCKANCTCIT